MENVIYNLFKRIDTGGDEDYGSFTATIFQRY